MKEQSMAISDRDEWDTGEHREPIKPVAPSRRGAPPQAVPSPVSETNSSGAGEQDQRDNGE